MTAQRQAAMYYARKRRRDRWSENPEITDITLSASDIDENATGTVGALAAVGSNLSNTTFSIDGGADAANFSISGSDLVVDTPFDYETQTTAEVGVLAVEGTARFREVFTITINDVVD